MNVNLNLLQAFIEVAELGSFRRAADAIGRTQSAVSMQIGQLEAQLGIKLFARTTRRVRLTAEGERLLEHVRSAMTDLTAGLREASFMGGQHRGLVAIACAPSVAGSRLPAVMAAFQRTFPQASAQLRELALAGIVDSVRMREVDFGIGPRPAALNGLTFDPVASDPICALFPVGALPVRPDGSGVSLASLEGRTVVLMGGLRPTIDEACREHGVTLSVRYEAQQVLTVLGLVRAGLGVAVVPGIAVPEAVGRDLCLRPIVAPDLVREIGIITQFGRRPTPLALEMIGLLRTRLLEPDPHA